MNTNSTQVGRWIQMRDLVPYEVSNQCLFPAMCMDGNISPRYRAYLAKVVEDFPDDAFDTALGLSANGKVYCLEFQGNTTYEQHQVFAMVDKAKKELNAAR